MWFAPTWTPGIISSNALGMVCPLRIPILVPGTTSFPTTITPAVSPTAITPAHVGLLVRDKAYGNKSLTAAKTT